MFKMRHPGAKPAMRNLFPSASSCIPGISICRRNHQRRLFSTHGPVLVLSNLYPQPNASAAGLRTSYILRQLCKASETWKSVHFAASAKETDDATIAALSQEGIKFHTIEANNTIAMKDLLEKIGDDLALVIHDKFYTEEAFSFHIHKDRPNAIQVVDMQDMHSLRRGRQALVEKEKIGCDSLYDSVMSYRPNIDDAMLLRELASLHRSDLSLVCSPAEHELLLHHYQLPPSKLCTASFWVQTLDGQERQPTWQERRHFSFVGGFRHDPNVDAVQQLVLTIWPLIRRRLPMAELHIYGAHASTAIQQKLSNSRGLKQGVHFKGFCEDLETILSQYRVLLAPLRFGAGIKGKIVDAWRCSLPVVTTPIGSEGMTIEGDWGGSVESSSESLADAAIRLHENKDAWGTCVQQGHRILQELYSEKQWTEVAAGLQKAVENRVARRSTDFTRSILWQQRSRSTEYFSRWIELKNKP